MAACGGFAGWRPDSDDAHQWHGNTTLNLQSADAERISLVLYYRTNMMGCESMEAEAGKAAEAKMRPLGARPIWNVGAGNATPFPIMDKEAMNEAVTTPDD